MSQSNAPRPGADSPHIRRWVQWQEELEERRRQERAQALRMDENRELPVTRATEGCGAEENAAGRYVVCLSTRDTNRK